MFHNIAAVFCLVFFLIGTPITAQSQKLKKVSIEDFKDKFHEEDSTANAIILYKYRSTYFNENTPDHWVLITEIKERIKILKQAGIKDANKTIKLRKKGSEKETITDLKVFVYKKDNRKVRIKKNTIENLRPRPISSNLNEVKLNAPNVEVGSIIEWSYKITSPFWKIKDLIIQEDLPTKFYFAKVKIPSYFNYNRIINGHFNYKSIDSSLFLDVKVKQYSKTYVKFMTGILKETIKDSVFQVTETETKYELKDIPALKEEPYINNIDNYRAFIGYELMSTDLPRQGYIEHSKSWTEVIRNIYDSDQFGGQLKNLHFLKNDAAQIKSSNSQPENIMQKAFELIKNKMSWDKNYGVFPHKNLKIAYEKKTGNIAEINLLLIGLLRECGLDAQPVLSRSINLPKPFSARPDGFNYVLVAVDIAGNRVLLDATEKLSSPNVLPKRTLHSEGKLVFNDGSFENINLQPTKASQINTIIQAEINHDGSVSGKQRSNYTGQEALKYRKKYLSLTKKEFNDHLIYKDHLDALVNFNIENLNQFNDPIIETIAFQWRDGITMNANDMYISPLLFLKLKSNPFKTKDRKHPVHFSYPSGHRKIISLKIPEGYKVSFTPKPINIVLPNQMGSYLFNIKKEGNTLNIISSFRLNTATIPSKIYPELISFYEQRVSKENENIVLIKL